MPIVKVIAKQTGFYGGSRRRAGSEFDMDLAVDGDLYVLPSWVDVATDLTRRLIEKRKANAEDKALRAALASGPRGHKQGTFIEAMNTGRGPLSSGEKAAGAARAASGGGASGGEALRKVERAEKMVRHERLDEDRK